MNQPQQHRPRIYWGWYVVAATFLAGFVAGSASSFTFSVLVTPMTADLAWSRSQLFLGITIAGLVAGPTSLVIGPVVDKYGARYVMTGGALILGSFLLLVSLVTTPWQYYLLFGIGLGVSRPLLQGVAGPTAVVNWFVEKRNRVLPIVSFAIPASGIMAIPVAFLAHNYSWREAWVMLGMLTLLLAVIPSWLFIRRRPEDMGLLPYGVSPGNTEDTDDDNVEKRPSLVEPIWKLRQVLKTRAFWLISINITLTGVPGGTIILHMGAFFSDKGFSPTAAATGVVLYAVGAGIARLLWGIFGEWFTVKHLMTARAFGYALGILIFLTAPGQLASYISVVLLGTIVGGGMQLDTQAWADYFGRGIVGRILGVQVWFRTISTAGGPIFAAWMFDTLGDYNSAFSIFSVLCLLAGIAMIFARRPIQSDINTDIS